jgi:stage IV sporulation protein B
MKKRYIFLTLAFLIAAFFIFSIVYPLNKDICIVKGRETNLSLPSYISIKASLEEEAIAVNGTYQKEFEISPNNPVAITSDEVGTFEIKLKAFGIIPVGTVDVQVLPDLKLYPCGWLIGVKMNTRGVIVVGLEDIETMNEEELCPAQKADIKVGDIIYEIDGSEVNEAEDIKEIFENKKSETASIKLKRGEEYIRTEISAVEAKDGSYKIGLWARDNIAGIGTMTFLNSQNAVFGALGHSINDVTTGILVPVKDGSIVNAHIISVVEGQEGIPGEIRGIFYDEDEEIGTLSKNTEFGLYGEMIKNKNQNLSSLPIATQSEITEGDAQILCSIDSEEPKYYDIVIEKKYNQRTKSTKGMLIEVIDKELLKKTGGIIQGMSGSPIIQNGKIVGAVTHVLVSNPTKGYGIFIEWMINEAGLDNN